MTYSNLTIEQRDAVIQITVQRPDKLNALNLDTLIELGDAVEDATSDDSLRALIITGAGEKAFVAGADIAEINALNPLQARDFSELGQQLMRQIENCGKPVIAAVNGFALGGGMELALACHIRIASDNARLGLPEITLGLMPGFGGSQRLLRMLGRSRAMQLILSGQPIDAATAEHWGLLAHVYSAQGLSDQAWTLALNLGASAPIGMRSMIEGVH
nr:enoyl-CoA hydratase-related protein [Gammaproteobacteria bacterium]